METIRSYFPDLYVPTPPTTLDIWGESVRAVGWIDSEHEFTKGTVAQEFLLALNKHLENPFYIMDWMEGPRTCTLCQTSSAFGKMFIASDEIAYVVPQLIPHYVEKHSYQPPQEFIHAVLQTPPDFDLIKSRVDKLRERGVVSVYGD